MERLRTPFHKASLELCPSFDGRFRFTYKSCLAAAPIAYQTSGLLPTISQHRLAHAHRVSFISVEAPPVCTAITKALPLFYFVEMLIIHSSFSEFSLVLSFGRKCVIAYRI
ncbi:hypothetical protein [Cytobacillus praedii]|uniref:hypothetical protein n=1 Tax=Cytobacillus praedii TaxID=1742358 RepID=UPI003F8159AF